jgi:hypothetical protein
VPLKWDYLIRVIPERVWKELRTLLLNLGVIDWDRTALKGEKCYYYRVTPKYRTMKQGQCTDQALCRKVHRLRAREYNDLQEVHRQLWRLGLDRTYIDAEQANSLIATWQSPTGAETDENYRERLGQQVKRIADRNYTLLVDDYGRVHTPITNLKKELRSCLYTLNNDGKRAPIAWLDVRNSQPLFLYVVCLHYLAGTREERYRMRTLVFDGKDPYRKAQCALPPVHNSVGVVCESTCTIPPVVTQDPPMGSIVHGGSSLSLPPPFLHYDPKLFLTARNANDLGSERQTTLINHGEYGKDVQRFGELVQRGTLYEDPTLMKKGENRAWVKEKFITALFSEDHTERDRPYTKELMKRLRAGFPTIAKVVSEIKRKDYARLPRLLQAVEAKVLIQNVCTRIYRERPHTLLLTVHDCVGTTRDAVIYVETVVREEVEMYGVTPQFHRESYAPTEQSENQVA